MMNILNIYLNMAANEFLYNLQVNLIPINTIFEIEEG
jgi:hypothetical protein